MARRADYHRLFDVEERFPAIARHTARLRDRPAVRFALAIEAGGAASSAAFRGHVAIEELLAS